jgi:hypothetical protein
MTQKNTKTVQVHTNKTLNRQNENNIAEKSNIIEVLGQKSCTLKKIQLSGFKSHRSAQDLF